MTVHDNPCQTCPVKKMRVVLLVSPDYAATYFANMLMRNVNVVGVFVEKQHRSLSMSEKVGKAFRLALRPLQTLKKMYDSVIFNLYNTRVAGRIDLKNFGRECTELFPCNGCIVVHTEGAKQINNPKYVEQMKKLQPDIIAICGTSIVKEPIMNLPPHGVLNLHTGLPQKYRGVSTTQWAIYNEEPEYIGSTVHYVDSGVDTGRIIYQGRPDIFSDDNPESINVKAVKVGTNMMIQAIHDIEVERVTSYKQEEVGKLYLDRAYTADVIKKVWENTEKGVIREYVNNKIQRDKKVIESMVGIYSESSRTKYSMDSGL
jgi:methionyl-tRNA formyltransferase